MNKKACEQCRLVPSHQNVCGQAGQIMTLLGANLNRVIIDKAKVRLVILSSTSNEMFNSTLTMSMMMSMMMSMVMS